MIQYIKLREHSNLVKQAAEWFHLKWNIPLNAYLDSMEDCLSGNGAVPQWYLAMDSDKIAGGLGVIENDFHNRPDLAPNVCAVYTEEEYRCKGVAGHLLDMVVDDLKSKAITPIYLLTDHTGFYERYGWEFLCLVQGNDEPEMSRMYIHR